MSKYAPVSREEIPNHKVGSLDYKRYWNLQLKRCLYGYKPTGGEWIPGAYYFYLNFCKIRLRDEASNRKRLDNPWYRDLDHEYFDMVYDAKKERSWTYCLKG